jgi:hypothetical protein
VCEQVRLALGSGQTRLHVREAQLLAAADGPQRADHEAAWMVKGGGGVGDYGGACAPEAATGRPGALWVASPPGSVEQPKAARQVRPGMRRCRAQALSGGWGGGGV